MEQYNPNQTLRDALIAEGNETQVDLLTEEAANITRQQIIDIVNSGSWGGVSITAQASLRDLAVYRIKHDLPIFPWKDQAFLDSLEDIVLGLLAY